MQGWRVASSRSSLKGCVTDPSDLRTVRPALRDPAPSGSPHPGPRLGGATENKCVIKLQLLMKMFTITKGVTSEYFHTHMQI